MSNKIKVFLVFIVYLILILSGPLTVFRNTSLESFFSNNFVATSVFQRVTGTLAFSLIFIQIVLGAYMNRFVQIIGAKAYRIHIVQGLITYGLVLAHPIFGSILIYQMSRSLMNVLYVFIPSMKTRGDVLLIYGKIALLLFTISVLSAYFRTRPFFRRNWRGFHILNYLVFYFAFIHSGLGQDMNQEPFSIFRWFCFFFVTVIVLDHFLLPFFRIIRSKF